jgi:hypothetical protein
MGGVVPISGSPDRIVPVSSSCHSTFGTRYTDLKKGDLFYHAKATPQQKDDADSTLEAKVRSLPRLLRLPMSTGIS